MRGGGGREEGGGKGGEKGREEGRAIYCMNFPSRLEK